MINLERSKVAVERIPEGDDAIDALCGAVMRLFVETEQLPELAARQHRRIAALERQRDGQPPDDEPLPVDDKIAQPLDRARKAHTRVATSTRTVTTGVNRRRMISGPKIKFHKVRQKWGAARNLAIFLRFPRLMGDDLTQVKRTFQRVSTGHSKNRDAQIRSDDHAGQPHIAQW